MLQSLAVRCARLLQLLSGPVLSGCAIGRLAGLRLPDRTVRIDEGRVGAAEFTLLEHDLAAESLRRMKLAHKTLVALHHLRRNHQRHRGNAGTADAGPDGEAAGALGEKSKPRTGAVVDLDAADLAVGVGIQLDRDIVRIVGGGADRHFDQAGGAANAQRRGRRVDLHVAGLGDGGRDKGRGTLGDVEDAGVALAAVFIDVAVDGDLRAGPQIESGGIDEGDAEGGFGRGLDHVVEIDVVLDLERRGRIVAGHIGRARQSGDVADRLLRCLCIGGRCGGARGGSRCRWLCGRCLHLRQLRQIGRCRRNRRRADGQVAGQQQ